MVPELGTLGDQTIEGLNLQYESEIKGGFGFSKSGSKVFFVGGQTKKLHGILKDNV